MGSHISLDLHLLRLDEYERTDDNAQIDAMTETEFAEYERYHAAAWKAYEQALAEMETLDDIDALADWTSFARSGAVWSIALPKKAAMNKELLLLVESLRERGIIHGYTVYSS